MQHQLDMFPDHIPDVVARIWRAVIRYYNTGTLKPPTREDLIPFFDSREQISLSTLDRARRRYPEYLNPWPIRRDQRPVWQDEPPIQELKPADGPTKRLRLVGLNEQGQQETVELVADGKGILHIADHLLQLGGSLALAAGSGYGLLDYASDGKINLIIKWCHVLRHVAQSGGVRLLAN